MNPLAQYNAARSEYDRLNNLALAGMLDWEVANPRPMMGDGDAAFNAWLDANLMAEDDIRGDLGTLPALDSLRAAEDALISWLEIELADAVARDPNGDEVAELFALRHARLGVRGRLLDMALRFARGRLRG